MNLRHAILLSASLVAVLLADGIQAVDAKPPNVIVVLSDDQGYGDFSCHGNPVLKTPNLDRLYAQSIRLTDFHVAPMCTPTRAELMTGLDAAHVGATAVCAGRSTIRRGIPTMADMFLASGYRTGQFGKWHLGSSWPNRPHDRGFEEAVYLTGFGVTSMPDYWPSDCFDGHFRHNGVVQRYPGYCTDVWFDLAMDWIKKQQAAAQPFFCYLPTNAPHDPHWVAEKYRQLYRGQGPERFFGMLANLDENMGRLLEMLDQTGLADNTILIYFNDNGGTAGVNVFNAGMRGMKTTYYDGGHRAACFIRWPAGKLDPPRDVATLTEVQDLLPTLIDLCGLKTPAGAHFDGTSLAGLLTGKTGALADRMLVVQYGEMPAQGEAAVLWNKWRLVKNSELYDVATDPGQKTDVAAQHPDLVKRMRDHYAAWWATVEPERDNLNPLVVGSAYENPVCLVSTDWANAHCDTVERVRSGQNTSAPWRIAVERDGTYEISLRRWPAEADAAIRAAVPEFKAVDGSVIAAGVALPVATARLLVDSLFDQTKPVTDADKAITFTVPLRAGQRVPLQTWFLDAKGDQLCGAYYVYVDRKE